MQNIYGIKHKCRNSLLRKRYGICLSTGYRLFYLNEVVL